MLGVLPDLPDDLSDPEQAALTAHFVHQIRTLLQIWDSGVGTQVFSVTSPVSGTGKTSLTLALGVSFAAADARTLLIDCDLIGGGLTSRANAIVKRKIGRILQREGLLTDKQLDEALKLASGSRRRLGEILVELGHLKEADLDSALVTQQKGSVGLLDAINGEDLDECIAETGIPGLSILPLGGATGQHASKVSPQALRRVLAEARKRYDTILIDTGPVPGSLEAAVVAAEVDGVILCVSRGEQRPLAEKCVQHLLTIGAKVAGVVFNRAKTQDMSVYGTAVRTSMPAAGGSSPAAATAESARLGPMARAVTYSGASSDPVSPTGGGGSETGNGQR
jgi:Mrp family chromosome partitioning ATPase